MGFNYDMDRPGVPTRFEELGGSKADKRTVGLHIVRTNGI